MLTGGQTIKLCHTHLIDKYGVVQETSMKSEDTFFNKSIEGMSLKDMLNKKDHEVMMEAIRQVLSNKQPKYIDFEVKWRKYTALVDCVTPSMVISHSALVLSEWMRDQLREWLCACSNNMYRKYFKVNVG